jgi:hypothetical protein
MLNKTKLVEVITGCHHALDELFLRHQEAVLLGKFDDAIRIFKCFKELHCLHMDFENNALISRLEELGIKGRWPASLYRKEHAKVHELMMLTEKNLLSLSEAPKFNKDLRRRVIEFFDKEKTFKGLCEHHQEREESGMFPELDRQTDTKWRRKMIEPFLAEWNSGMKRSMTDVGMEALP